jgi:hypothetical protein
MPMKLLIEMFDSKNFDKLHTITLPIELTYLVPSVGDCVYGKDEWKSVVRKRFAYGPDVIQVVLECEPGPSMEDPAIREAERRTRQAQIKSDEQMFGQDLISDSDPED